VSLRFGILTLSDRSSKGERADLSGPALVDVIHAQGWIVVRQQILPDDMSSIVQILTEWADDPAFDVILTTGGTGFAARDVTPEATRAVIQREAPGLAEAMRAGGLKKTPHAMLSRSVAGIRGSVLIVNLPGSPKAAVENLATIMSVLPHAVQLLKDDPGSEALH
jgi:molybdenum cofactor synthesis domain-containing protein